MRKSWFTAVSFVSLLILSNAASGALVESESVTFQELRTDERIRIERDAAGIPTVDAPTLASGYAGLCYAMAQDRLWQMDFLRRLGQGRLAEIFGNDPDGATVGGDIVNRTLGIARNAREKVDAASLHGKLALRACSIGINAWIAKATASGALPVEFGIFGYQPEPWRAEDSLTVFAALVSGLDQITAFTKVDRAVLGSLLGPDVAAKLVIDQLDQLSLFDRHGEFNDPRIFLRDFVSGFGTTSRLETQRFKRSIAAFERTVGGRPNPARAAALLQAMRAASARARTVPAPATNLLLVGGGHTATGKPIFENDFHLPNFTPSLIYFARLNVAGEFRLKGKFVPSFPAAIGGRNDDLVWGVTFAILDTADFFLERLNSAGDQVYYRNRLVPIEARQEVIQVAGAAPITITVRTTPHGPIVSDAIPPLQGLGTLALQTTYAKREWVFDGLFELHRADSIAAFRWGLRRQSVGLNYAVADARFPRGNIAYQLAGLAPQRNLENTFVPVRGDNGLHEWRGYANQSQLPFTLNPPAGFIAVTNNRIVPENYAPDGVPIYLSRYGDQPYRTKRAVQLVTRRIDADKKLSFADVSAVPADSVSAVTPAMARIYANVIAQAGLPADIEPATLARLQAMIRDLRSYDGNTHPDSRATLVFHTLLRLSLKNLIVDLFPGDPAFGQQVFTSYTRDVVVNSQMLTMVQLLNAPQAPFFGATGPGDAVAARNRAVIASLREAERLLVAQLGPDMTAWRWGAVHVLVSTHPLARAIPDFALAPAPFAGDNTTLNFGGFFSGGTPFSKGAQLLGVPEPEFSQRGGLFAVFFPDQIAAERVTWDVRNRSNDVGILSTGQSGDPRSPHWGDMRLHFVAGEYVPF